MKIFASEFNQSYKTYSFGYCLYGSLSNGEDLSVMYDSGFLPYSGNKTDSSRKLFYMARSARIPLASWQPSSENRRILKKFDAAAFEVVEEKGMPKKALEEHIPLATTYFETRHGANIMTEERLRLIFSFHKNIVTRSYYAEGKLVAFVVEVQHSKFRHYWFSFYDLSYAYNGFGMWLMLDGITKAKEAGLEYYYLGTVYNDKALYKTQFKALEFWDGEAWSDNTGLLRQLAKVRDPEHAVTHTDRYKEEH